ncbi:MAG: ABC transporter ATP-binding protein, partial [Methanobrevibacter sp.]|nr:ABC transporter ATP-binding protein [Methanobrevibacter sp.]
AIDIFKRMELKENEDFSFDKYGNGGFIRLYTHLELRDKFNAIFVKAGIDVKKVNLCEENLEEFFTRFVSNN